MPFDMSTAMVKLSRREQDAIRGKLAKMRSDELTGHLCRITREALADGRILTPLSLEGLFRQVIRSSLCLQGWSWKDADGAAVAIVGVVLSILQAKRPSWNEGQPDWAIERGSLIERTRCANCGNPLPEDRPKFCSNLCKGAHHQRLIRLRAIEDADTMRALERGPL